MTWSTAFSLFALLLSVCVFISQGSRIERKLEAERHRLQMRAIDRFSAESGEDRFRHLEEFERLEVEYGRRIAEAKRRTWWRRWWPI